MPQVSYNFTEKQIAYLTKEAVEEGTSRNEILRRLINKAMGKR